MYRGVTMVFDVDGTLCPLKEKEQEYKDLIPDREMVKRMRQYRVQGVRILLYSARNMRKYNGDLTMINTYTAAEMKEWLKKWKIPYDELYLGKPWPGERGIYVDDRAVRPDEFLKYTFDELEKICKKSTRGKDEK